MIKKLFLILLFLSVYIGVWLASSCNKSSPDNKTAANGNSENDSAANPFFAAGNSYDFKVPDFDKLNRAPDWWKEDVFHLSQAYPKNYDSIVNSTCPVTECTWEKTENNFRTQPIKYLQEVIKYAYEGNLEVNWVVQKNTRGRKWFHAPYLDIDQSHDNRDAREFIRGLTKERPSCIQELSGGRPCYQNPIENWAVGFYNERAASYIGKVWNEMLNPNGRLPNPENFNRGFPDGSVAIKLLFTSATEGALPNLRDGITWETDIRRARKNNCNNRTACFRKLRLLQIDIAVKHKNDANAPTGWVFGTFIYKSPGQAQSRPFINYDFSPDTAEARKWLNIGPVGLMFGNDPTVRKGDQIQQSLLNTQLGISQHYGCGDDRNLPDARFRRRLSGPVDNPMSSCLSCHARAEVSKSFNFNDLDRYNPRCTDNEIPILFRNINPENAQDPTFTRSTSQKTIISLDYSLQLHDGIDYYCIKNPAKCGLNLRRGDTFNIPTRDGDKTFTIE